MSLARCGRPVSLTWVPSSKELLQLGELSEVWEPRVAHLSIAQGEPVQFGELGEVREGGVADPGVCKVDRLQVGELGEVREAGK